LGEALTALSNGEALQVPIGGTLVRVPLPKDFRIIGTLNSFDRNYLNQISKALKRRFAFVEVLPPTRMRQEAEQGIVLYKVLKSLEHLSKAITLEDTMVNWQDVCVNHTGGVYLRHRMKDNLLPFLPPKYSTTTQGVQPAAFRRAGVQETVPLSL
jgi:hypothetical protein